VDVGQNTTLGNGDVAQQLVQLLVVSDGELEVAWDDARLLVVASRVTGQLKDLGGQVLQHGGEVDGRAGTDTLGVVALAEQAVDTADGERETGLGRTTGGRGWSGRRTDTGTGRPWAKTHDWALDLEPLALPPDLPPVILKVVGVRGVELGVEGAVVRWRAWASWSVESGRWIEAGRRGGRGSL